MGVHWETETSCYTLTTQLNVTSVIIIIIINNNTKKRRKYLKKKINERTKRGEKRRGRPKQTTFIDHPSSYPPPGYIDIETVGVTL